MKARNLSSILAVLALTACSSGQRVKAPMVAEGPSTDVLSKESLWRYSPPLRAQLKIAGEAPYNGLVACYEGDFKKGQEDLRQALSSGRNDPEYWNSVGTCHYLKGDLDKAEYFYLMAEGTALQRKITFPAAQNNLGLVYLKLGHRDNALEQWEKASRSGALTPTFNLGVMLAEYGHVDRALGLLGKLHRLNSKDPELLLALAMVHLQSGDHKKALGLFEKLPETALERPAAAIGLAHALLLQGKVQEAQKALGRARGDFIQGLDKYRTEIADRIELELDKRG